MNTKGNQGNQGNLGPPPPNYIPWEPTSDEIYAMKARGRITDAAEWDNMTVENRRQRRPDWNPHKRWFEQKENRATQFKPE